MIKSDRLINYSYYHEPFPIIVFENFLNQVEAEEAINCIDNERFDEIVNDGRKNIRKGTETFKNTIRKQNILSEIYNFFNNKDVFENLFLKLEKVSKLSKNNFVIDKMPNNFKKDFYEYKKSIHNKKFLKKFLNFANKKLFKNLFYNSFYFEINYSMAKKGYKLKTHKDKENRMVVFLLYLNKLNEEGGSFEVYSKNLHQNSNIKNDFILEKKFKPEAGKLIVFLSNPLSYHNVSEILNLDSKRYFCYGGYTSLNNVNWEKNN